MMVPQFQIGVLLLVPHAIEARLQIIPGNMTWSNALSSCRDVNGSLAVLGTDHDNEDLEGTLTQLQEDEEVWIGQRDDLGPWAWAKGCWDKFTTNYSTELPFNSGSACLKHCKTDQVFVQGSLCICDRAFTIVHYSQCNYSCGDGGACGGAMSVTHYQECFYHCRAKGNISQLCRYFNLNESSPADQFVADDCGNTHFPICKVAQTDVTMFAAYPNISRLNWKGANDYCRQHGGVMADIADGLLTIKYIWETNGSTEFNPTFWVALNKAAVSISNLTGSVSPGNMSRCYAIQKEYPSERDAYPKNCSDLASALCRVGVEIDQSSSAVVTSPQGDTTNTVPYSVTPVTSETRTTSPEEPGNLTVYIVLAVTIAAVISAIVAVGIVVSKRKRRRSKSSTVTEHPTRPVYDYMELEVNDNQADDPAIRSQSTPNEEGIGAVGTNYDSLKLTRRRSDNDNDGPDSVYDHTACVVHENNYHELDISNPHKVLVDGSALYDSTRVEQEGNYHELPPRGQTSDDNNLRNSLYAVAKSPATLEGDYDLAQSK